MNKKVLALLLTLCMIFTIVPVNVMAEEATDNGSTELSLLDLSTDESTDESADDETVPENEGEEEETTTSTGTLAVMYVEQTGDRARVYGEANNISANESVVVKLYSGNTLVGTTSRKGVDFPYTSDELTINIVISGSASSSWETVWENGAPSAYAIPDKAELIIDDRVMSTVDVKLNGPDDKAKVVGVFTDADGKITKVISNTDFSSDFTATLNAAFEEGGNIVLLRDVELTDTLKIPAEANVVLDLNGKTISQTKEQTTGYQMILNDGVLTINDTVGGGKISYTDSGNGGEYISDAIYNRGTLVINGGTIENLSSATVASNGYPHAVDNYSGIRDTSLTINGGTIYCAEYSAIRMFCVSATNKADLVINDGTIKGAVDMQNGSKDAALGSLTINGGTFETTKNANNIRFANWNGGATEYGIAAEIKGGSFNGGITTAYVPAAANWNSKVITGGTFTNDLSAFAAEGYTFEVNTDGTYGVAVDPTYGKVAKVGETYFTSLQEAINAAQAGETVTLINDVELDAYLNVTTAGEITLDLAGHSITRTGTGIYVNNTATVLTITGEGSVSAAQAVWAAAGKVIIENGTFYGTGDAIYTTGSGEIVINGGHFSAAETDHTGNTYCVLNQNDGARETSSITVYGGKFVGFNPADNASEGAGTNFVADGYRAVKSGDNWTVKENIVLSGAGTATDPYLITNLKELKAFRDYVNEGNTYADKYVKLTADIDLTGEVWTPIGTSNYDKTPTTEGVKMFAGNFDGGNHTITGLTSDGYVPDVAEAKEEYSFGLFGYVYGANISNVKLTNVDIDCGTRKDSAGNERAGSGVAALIGYYYPANEKTSVISNCHVLSGTVKASNNMGGLIGHMDSQKSQPKVDITIKDCSNAADITTEAREAGGILGLMNSAREGNYLVTMRGTVTFKDCVNTGDITSLGGGAPSAGGILGRDHNQAAGQRLKIVFDGCENSGTITVTANGETHAAGIGAGFYSTGAWLIAKDCNNTGNVVVNNSNSEVYAGGLISYGGVVELINSTSTGTVTGGTANNTYVGGAQNILFLEKMPNFTDTVNGYTYYLNGGTSPEYAALVDDAAGGGNFHLVETASKDGFVFGGWYDNAGFTGEKYTVLDKNVKTYYAKWIGPVAKIGDAKYDTLQAAINAAKNGETVTLLADTTESEITVVDGKNFTLDLDGKTLTLPRFMINKGATVEIKNGSIVGNTAGKDAVRSAGNLTLTNVNVTGLRHTVRITEGTAVIDGGTYKYGGTEIVQSTYHIINIGDDNTGATVTIKDGTFIAGKGIVWQGSNAVLAQGTSTVTIEGGNFSNSNLSLVKANATAILTVKGGTYDQDPTAYVADGYKAVESNGTWTVREKVYVAEANGNKYESIQEAVNAAQAGATITVIADIKLANTVTINKAITLDLGGKTITTAATAAGDYVDAFTILADVTVTGEGTVDARPSHGYTFYVGDKEGNAGNLTIENGTFYGETSVVNNRLGTVTINGGTFEVSLENADDDYRFTLNCIDANYNNGAAKIVVKGGTFYKFNPADNAAEGTSTSFVAKGYKATDLGDGTYGVEPNMIFEAHLVDANGETHWLSPMSGNDLNELIETAKVWYDSLQGTYGFTIKVLEDCEIDETVIINFPLTLDLGGNTITTAETEDGNFVDAFTILADVTVTGEGTINAIPSYGYTFYVGDKNGNAGNLTIENGTFYGVTSVVNNRLGTVTINGGTFEIDLYKDGDYRFTLNCIDANYNNGTAKIVVKGGTFYKFNPADNAAEGTSTSFVAKGYKATDLGDGTYGVEPNKIFEAHLVDANGEAHWLSPMRSNDLNALLETSKVWYDSLQGTYGFTIKVLEDCEIDETVIINFPLTLDLGGNTITTAATAAGDYVDAFTILADVTVKGGTIDARPSHGYTFYVGDKEGNAGNLTIENGTFYGETSVVNNRLGTVTINGGTFEVSLENAGDDYRYTLNCIDTNYNNGTAKIVVKGGTFYNFNPADNEAETGDHTNFMAEGYLAEEVNGVYTVRAANYVAQLGDVKYESLQDAIKAAKDDDTITVIADIELANTELQLLDNSFDTYFLVEGKTVTINLNGKTISGAYTGTNTMLVGAFSTDNNGHLTLTGNGTVDVTATNKVYSLFSNYSDGCSITIENGTYKLDAAANCLIHTSPSAKEGEGNVGVIVNGGNFYLGNVGTGTNGQPWIFNANGSGEQHVWVTGGTYNADIFHQYYAWEVQYPDNKSAIKDNGNGTWTVVDAVAYIGRNLDEYTRKTGYETIDAALAAAQAGETVTILKGDYTANLGVNKAITVIGETDEQGNNLVNITGKLNVTADGAAVKNLNVNNGSANAGYINAKDVLIEGCTVVGGNGFRSCYTKGTVTFKDSIITGSTYGIHFDGSADGNIVIEDCVITGWTSFASTINKVTISDTEFAQGNYNQLRFYQNAELTDVVFNPNMTVDFGKNEVNADFTNCSVTDGSPLTDVIYLPDIANMGIEVKVDNVPVVVEAMIGEDKAYLKLADAIADAQDGDTVVLAADVALDATVKVNKNITLDLNGKTITGTDNATKNFALIEVQPSAELTINDTVGTGKITLIATNDRDFNNYSSVISNQRGKLTVNGGTIEHLGGTDMAYGIDNLTNGKGTYAETVVNGGTIKSTYRGIRQFLNGVEAQNILTVNGGTIEGANKSIWMQDPSAKANSGTLTVGENAELKGDVYLYVTPGSTEWPVEISIAVAALDGESTVVTGNVPAGYVVEVNNGTWGVREANYVAKIGEVGYESLADAINAAKANDTIVFLADITENVTISKNLTIDGANFKYTGKISVSGNTTAAVVKNVNFVDYTADYAITTNRIKSITVENCTLNGYDGFLYANKSTPTIVVNNVTMNGGIYGIHWVYGTTATLENVTMTNVTNGLLIQNYAAKTINLKNCTISNINIWERDGSSGVQTFKFEGDNTVTTLSTSEYSKYVLAGTDATLTAPEGYNVTTTIAEHLVKYDNGTYKVVKAAAKIGDKLFETFVDALNAVQDGETITVMDVEGSERKTEIDFTKAITFNITGNSDYELPTVTFQNATVNIVDADIEIGELDARQNAIINVKNSTVETVGGSTDGIVKAYYNGKINIEDSEVYAHQFTVMGVVNLIGSSELTVTWQTNVYGNGLINIGENATLNTAAMHLIGKDYSGRDNTDADRVGKPATIVVDGGTLNVGTECISINGANYNYNSSKGINIGTVAGKSAVLDIKNGAKVNIHMADGETANIGADGTVNVDGELTVACRKEGGTATLVNNGSIVLTTADSIVTANECGKVTTTVENGIVKYVGGTYKVVKAVAEIGETKYATLAEAIAAANDDETVTLLADYSNWKMIQVGKTITIDLNGFNINRTFGGIAVDITDGTVTIKGNGKISGSTTGIAVAYDAALVLESGVIVEGRDGHGVDNDGALTINGANITATEYGVALYSGDSYAASLKMNSGSVSGVYGIAAYANTKVEINDGTVTGTTAGLSGEGSSHGTEFIVNGGTISSETGVGIYHPQNGTLTVTGGTISGATGINMKSGTITVTGGTVEGTGAKADYGFVGGGFNCTGDALVIESCGYPGGAPVADIKGGTFNSTYAAPVASYAGNGVTETVTGFVADGTFNTKPEDNLAIDGYEFTQNADGTYGVETIKVAEVNGTKYETLAAALAAANAGDKVKLVKDATENYVIVTPSVTLDLNGNTLNANYVIGLNGSDVIDSSADNSGLLKADKNSVSLDLNNAQLPAYVDGEGYKFFEIEISAALEGNADNRLFYFQLRRTKRENKSEATDHMGLNELLKDTGANDHDLSMMIEISWITADGNKATQRYEFKEATVIEMAKAQYDGGIGSYECILNEADRTEVTYSAVIVSGTGAEIKYTYVKK